MTDAAALLLAQAEVDMLRAELNERREFFTMTLVGSVSGRPDVRVTMQDLFDLSKVPPHAVAEQAYRMGFADAGGPGVRPDDADVERNARLAVGLISQGGLGPVASESVK